MESCQELLELQTFKEALKSLTTSSWKVAMDEEYASLFKNRTWELILLPTGRTHVHCKWVFKLKYKSNGSIECYKV
jgi:histone deacetylase 1/2